MHCSSITLPNFMLHHTLNFNVFRQIVCEICLSFKICYSTGLWYSAEYWSFFIGDVTNKFQLSVSGFSGDTDDALQFPQFTTTNYGNNAAANGQKFSTEDKDNDAAAAQCAQTRGGGWWYGSTCSMPVLNADGMANWYDGRSTQQTAPNVVASRMKIQLAN
jgi:Fibrinogen beta and gamma chains, C-terminal globular domain